jgi:hypothetical protein
VLGGESYTALACGMQNALWSLGGAPAVARQVGCPMSDSKDGRSLRVWNMA